VGNPIVSCYTLGRVLWGTRLACLSITQRQLRCFVGVGELVREKNTQLPQVSELIVGLYIRSVMSPIGGAQQDDFRTSR
jgi:hypothetical protein